VASPHRAGTPTRNARGPRRSGDAALWAISSSRYSGRVLSKTTSPPHAGHASGRPTSIISSTSSGAGRRRRPSLGYASPGLRPRPARSGFFVPFENGTAWSFCAGRPPRARPEAARSRPAAGHGRPTPSSTDPGLTRTRRATSSTRHAGIGARPEGHEKQSGKSSWPQQVGRLRPNPPATTNPQTTRLASPCGGPRPPSANSILTGQSRLQIS